MSEAPRTAAGGDRSDRGDEVTAVRITVRTAVFTVALILGVFVLRNAFASAQRVLGWAAASVAVAVLIEPLSTWLGRYIPRLAAVLLTFVVVGVGIGALVFTTVSDLDREVDRLQEVAPSATQRVEERDDDLGAVMRDLALSARVELFLDELDDRVGSGTDALAENAPTAPVYFVSAVLTIFLLFYGPGIVQGGASRLRDEHRRLLVLAVLHDATQRARRTVVAMVLQGLVFGALVWAAATVLEVPAPVVLGLVAGLSSVLPDVGIILGVLPTVALAAGLESGRAAVLLLAGALVLQMFEAMWLRQRVDRWGVAVGPAVVWVVAVVGYTMHGPGMAVYGVIYAVFVVAVVDQVPAARRSLDAAEVPGSPAPSGTT